MKILVDPDTSLIGQKSQSVKWAPDRSAFAVVTREGDLDAKCNRYRLMLYEASDVMRSVASTTPAKSRELVQFCSASNRPGIFGVRWMFDSRTIAFIGEPAEELPQIYAIDAASGRLRKVSNHPTAVRAFDLSAQSDRFIYLAETPMDWSERRKSGYVVGTESYLDVAAEGHDSYYFTRMAYFIGTSEGSDHLPVDEAPFSVIEPIPLWFDLSLSPSGRWAIAIRQVTNPPPSWWLDYRASFDYYFEDVNDPNTQNYSDSVGQRFLQFLLIDMSSGRAQPILNAPTGFLVGGLTLAAHWSADERFVVLSNTFLPIRIEPGNTRGDLSATPYIVSIDMETRIPRKLLALVENGQPVGGGLLGTSFDGVDTLVARFGSKSSTETERAFRLSRSGTWDEVPARSQRTGLGRLHIVAVQDVNRAPELAAIVVGERRTSIISDLNPRLRHVQLGHIQTIKWMDDAGREWTGGLLKPPHCRGDRRCPLVIQTHGYDPNRFLIDGPWSSASGYAMRALAGRGIAVLQVADGVGPIGNRDELETQVAGYAAAIRMLSDEGVIDPDRVGIHGWSRTGFYVQHALIFSGLRIAAASVSDASSLSIYTSVLFYGRLYPGMKEFERLIGAPLWGDDSAKMWAARDPTFHLDQLRTPLRIEAYDSPWVWWDTFALLRRQQRPVELIFFPDAAHSLIKPAERLMSQEGTVDWYDFWLNGREDDNQAKRAMYTRWRMLRSQHEAAQRHSNQ